MTGVHAIPGVVRNSGAEVVPGVVADGLGRSLQRLRRGRAGQPSGYVWDVRHADAYFGTSYIE